MIGKVCFRRKDGGKTNFTNLVKYCANPSKAAYVGFRNVASIEDAGIEMEALATGNTRCADPGYHFVLSWKELERPSQEQCEEAAGMVLRALGLENCQAIWALHTNTENTHLEFAVNRIDVDTLRAVRPGDGWDKKALHRVCREIELKQGWSRDNGMFVITPSGEIVKKEKAESLTPNLSTNAQDMEAHIAQKSAERIGQEAAAPIIRDSQSWDEVHSRLSEQGIRYERKGSGAVLRIGETVIKASAAGRDLTLAKLERRLGDFREASETKANVSAFQRAPEPVARAAVPKVKEKWEEFIELRTAYFKAKKDAESGLRDRHKRERSEMSKRQKDERKQMFSVSWKGRGDELNRLRSVTASIQKTESLYLQDRQAEEREALRNRYPVRYPTFKAWLDLDEHSPELSVLYRYPNEPMLYTPFDSPFMKKPLVMEDLRGFEARAGNMGGVAYVRRGAGNAADFVDYGRKILISGKYDRKSILAALQLAQQKWGGVNISGDDRYKKMCLEVAAQEGIRIFEDGKEASNTMVETVRSEQMERRSVPWKTTKELVEAKREEFQRYSTAVGADEYRVTVIDRLSEKTTAFVWGKGKTPDSSGRHSSEKVLEGMESLVQQGEQGLSVTITPLSRKTHHILVDDMSEESLKRLMADGYEPACVIESSPCNFQAMLNVPKFVPDDPDERSRGNRLARELNRVYGDKNLSGAEHAHRMPGFPNCKSKHRREDGTFPESSLLEARGGICEKSVGRLMDIRREDLRQAERRKEIERNLSSMPGSSVDAYWRHYEDILEHQGAPDDYSKLDAMLALRMKITGHSQVAIQSAIETCAPQVRRQALSDGAYMEKYGARNWKDYAKRTADYAYSGKSAAQETRLSEYLNVYLKIEGRQPERQMGTRRHEIKEAEAAGNNELTWEKAIDEYLANPAGWNKSRPVTVLDHTPLVFQLIGAKDHPITMNARHFGRNIDTEEKQKLSKEERARMHPLPPEMVKQIPHAMSDPVMILKDTSTRESEAKDTTCIVMLELRHEGKSIVVPFTLNAEQARKKYNIIDSFYTKDGRDVNELGKGVPYEEWFLKQIENGGLLYINRNKARNWTIWVDKKTKSHPETQVQSASPVRAISSFAVLEALLQNDSLMQNIPTEVDLVKLGKNRSEEQSENLGDSSKENVLVGIEAVNAPSAENKQNGSDSHHFVVPEVGRRVAFHFKGKDNDEKTVLVGKIVSMNESKGTVTIESGKGKYTVFRGKGYFTEPREIPREQTMEYALESAQKFAGEDGKVYFARKDGEYTGEVLEVGPAYAAQRVGQKTVILHRLKDFKDADMLQKGIDVVVKRESGRSLASLNTRGAESEKGSSMER